MRASALGWMVLVAAALCLPLTICAREGETTTSDDLPWSFRPIQTPAVPSPKNPSWARTDVDRFILARLDREGLKPNPDADRVTLIRRVAGVPLCPMPFDTARHLVTGDGGD